MTAIRIFHIIISWEYKKQKYEQELVITAPDKADAKEKAKNRLPVHLLKNQDAEDTIKITVHDLGTPENWKTYYSSKLNISAKNKDALPLEYQVALLFAVLWGHETGYRAGNPYISGSEQAQLEQLYNFEDKERNLHDLAVRYLTDNDRDPKEYFRNYLSDVLGEIVPEIEQMTPPININEMESAEEQAKKIIQNAEARSQEILREAQEKATAQWANQISEMNSLIAKLTSQPTSTDKTRIPPVESKVPDTAEDDMLMSAEPLTENLPFEDIAEDTTENPTNDSDRTDGEKTETEQADTEQESEDKYVKTDPATNQENIPEENPKNRQETDKTDNEPEPETNTEETEDTKPVNNKPKEKKKVFRKQTTMIDITDMDNETPKEDRPVITEDDVSEELLLKILADHTVTQKGNPYPAINAYNKWKQDKSKSEKEWMFYVLAFTDMKAGLTGWDRLCKVCRKSRPNCILDFRIPESKMEIPYKQTA